jgi:hypothetical protein
MRMKRKRTLVTEELSAPTRKIHASTWRILASEGDTKK